jgi:hypothetical protein
MHFTGSVNQFKVIAKFITKFNCAVPTHIQAASARRAIQRKGADDDMPAHVDRVTHGLKIRSTIRHFD